MSKTLFSATIPATVANTIFAQLPPSAAWTPHNKGQQSNGYGKKTITGDYGECEISVPRDRNGEFEPKVIEKRQTHTDEIDQKIMAMYAKGMSQRDIEDTLKEIYGAEISQGLNSSHFSTLDLMFVTAEQQSPHGSVVQRKTYSTPIVQGNGGTPIFALKWVC